MAVPEDFQPYQSTSSPEASVASGGPGARFPTLMLCLTGIYVFGVWLARVFASDLDDAFGVGMDIINVVSLFAFLALVLLWVGWFVFRSRWRWGLRIAASIAVIALPVGLMKILRPVLGGDVTIQRFEPIWESRPEVSPTEVDVVKGTVDLKTETPDDFPRFLGPQQNTIVSTGVEIDGSNLAASKILWKQPIGAGWSGFVARNGFAVTMEQRQGQECVTCYSIADGSLQWMYQHQVRHRDTLNLGRIGPRSTPTVHDGLVYAVGAVGNLVCLDGGDGTEVWQVDLNELLGLQLVAVADADGQMVSYEGNSKLSWGRSGAPLIVDDMVVVPGGGPTGGTLATLLAFDRHTGELLWKGGSEMIAYGSPTLAKVAGVDQILMVAQSLAMGFNPQTGDVLWQHSRPGKTDGEANTTQLTVVSENQLLTSKGYSDGGGELIEVTHDKGKWTATGVWENDKALKTKLMSPVIYDGHSYALSNGFLECVRLADGERLWKQRGRYGHGQMLMVGDLMLLHSESGELIAFRPSPEEFDELGTFRTIDGVCWNTLCLYGNKLLVRSEIEAACIELPTK